MNALYLLYLDRYHLGDPTFVQALARELAAVQQEGRRLRTLIVHGGGEKAERTLEAQGTFVERTDGVLAVETPDQARLVERATREANQELVATLTDAVVSAVGVQGADRGLLRVDAEGQVEGGRAGWLYDLVTVRVVPVVSALAAGTDGAREVATAEAATALRRALARHAPDTPVHVVVFTRHGRPGLYDGAERLEQVSVEALPEEVVAEPEAVRASVRDGASVLLTNLEGAFGAEGPAGTTVVRE